MFFPKLYNNLKPPFGIRINRSHPLARGLFGSWVFNEAAGITAFDGSGKDNHSIFINNPAWVLGPRGWEISFNGTNSYLRSAKNADLTGNPDFSIEAWIKIPAGATITSAWPPVLWWGGANLGASVFFSLSYTYINKFYVGFYAGGQRMVGTFSNNIEHHFLWTRTGGGQANQGNILYLDGVDVPLEDEPNVSNPSLIPNVSNSQFYVQNATDGRYFEGSVSKITIWNRRLSPGEAGQLYINPFAIYEELNHGFVGGLPGLTLFDFERGMWRGGVPGIMRGVC